MEELLTINMLLRTFVSYTGFAALASSKIRRILEYGARISKRDLDFQASSARTMPLLIRKGLMSMWIKRKSVSGSRHSGR